MGLVAQHTDYEMISDQQLQSFLQKKLVYMETRNAFHDF